MLNKLKIIACLCFLVSGILKAVHYSDVAMAINVIVPVFFVIEDKLK